MDFYKFSFVFYHVVWDFFYKWKKLFQNNHHYQFQNSLCHILQGILKCRSAVKLFLTDLWSLVFNGKKRKNEKAFHFHLIRNFCLGMNLIKGISKNIFLEVCPHSFVFIDMENFHCYNVTISCGCIFSRVDFGSTGTRGGK